MRDRSRLPSIQCDNTVWVGGNDKKSEGTFVWQTSKKKIQADYFAPDEPNGGSHENCAQLYCLYGRAGKLNDASCEKS